MDGAQGLVWPDGPQAAALNGALPPEWAHQAQPPPLMACCHFSNWAEVFPSATSVVTLVDWVSHHAEVVNIKGGSWRLQEAKERDAMKAAARAKK